MNPQYPPDGNAPVPARPWRIGALVRRASFWAWLVAIAVLLAGMAGTLAIMAGFFDTDPVHLYGMSSGQHPRFAAVYFSGDMGLRFGMGTHVAPALAARKIPVYGISSPALFSRQRSQGEVDALVADTIRQALARSGADQAILMGQSFGADILVAGLSALPPEFRARIAAVVLVVPARTAYFRADPTGLRYHGTPDATLTERVKALDWAPLICIYGQSETESLCPSLMGTGAKVIELPGGHFLHNDHDKLTATIFNALGPVLRQKPEQRK
jgi:type IV secretory pathway VirJ component